MMIGSITATGHTGYASPAARIARPPDTPTRAAPADDGVSVDLSPAGKLLSELPPIILDPKVHMANAEARLKELMGELGIPPGTEIDIELSSSGKVTVSGDHDKLSDLQDMLNDGTEMELRNALVGAHTSSIIQRIGAASRETQEKVEASPGSAEMLWNQLLAEADHIKRQDMNFSFSGGTLDGVFADGTLVAVASAPPN